MLLASTIYRNIELIYKKIISKEGLTDEEWEYIDDCYDYVINISKDLALKYEEIAKEGASDVDFLCFKFKGVFYSIVDDRYETTPHVVDNISLVFAMHAFMQHDYRGDDTEHEDPSLSGDDTEHEDPSLSGNYTECEDVLGPFESSCL